MIDELEDARKLAHGTYDDVIVAEHRNRPGAHAAGAAVPWVVLELPEGSRVIDKSPQFEVDGVLGAAAPTVGASYRLIVAAGAGTSAGAALRYESMKR